MTPDWSDKALQDRVLYRDRLIMVINKPAGLPVHPGPGGGPTVEDWFPRLCFEHPRPPALAHRLDRDTAGCLALGRSQKGLSRLGKLFEQRKIQKVYWAVVQGVPAEDSGIVDLPLAKVNGQRGWKMKADRQTGQPAVTEWRLLGHNERRTLSWLECRPQTGRTHQIRVHCQIMGLPLVGDPVYGPASGDEAPPMMHLLARSLTIPLYSDKPPVMAEAPVPSHMQQALAACGWQK
ncbi:RluA family pseudouridine synthase [Insolitispirillum peregrinum]|uniref:tRNA pseudouridine32 synthase / 23S rRNA pseudouridine746 synthase n=1 Tax=Insolitispirillum peregrinum TaxID=80876 RepID=A0A1N7IJR0_9PROT|nr:RluA family pseudouridine synthase [Insolitispirillum peregrinum]SIS37333.1 tRNA pseudouridine32 synthase / 23S rRNA pseudouridine746 synthase [Insolitispirillum peregrinum]